MVIDEVHLVADESRGPTLETLLVRLKTRKRPTSICALSAVISNPQEKSKEGGIVSMGEQAPRLYANTFSIEASLFDFCFKFGLHDQAQHEKGEHDEIACVFVSPSHAKAIARILNSAIDAYEAQFGKLASEQHTKPAGSAQ
ncbi:MAG: DUF3467 domain-containing protein [Firmicutes bacterium]|nr:DUF3467 domain-containing protein [Bacillota bacterium]